MYRWIWAYWMSPFAWSLRAVAINEMSCPPRSQTGMAELESFGFQTDRWRPALCVRERRLRTAGCHTAAPSDLPEHLFSAEHEHPQADTLHL